MTHTLQASEQRILMNLRHGTRAVGKPLNTCKAQDTNASTPDAPKPYL